MRSLIQILKDMLRVSGSAVLKVYLDSRHTALFDPDRVERILVFAYHGLGNFILYTPAIKLLRKRFPNARIDLQVGNSARCEEVLEGSELFDNVCRLPYSAGLSAWIRRAIEIRSIKYDLTINEFHSHSWILSLLVIAGDAPHRAGHVTSPGWSERFSHYGFTFNIGVMMKEEQHEIDRYLDLMAAVGAEASRQEDRKTFIHLNEEDREFAASFFKTARLRSNYLIGLQPGTSPNMRWKQWPIERYRELIENLLDQATPAHLVVFGSPGEVEMIGSLVKGLEEKVTIAAGRTTIKQVAALIEACDLLVCNDSGLMHVAAAVGTRVAAIYGPTDLARTRPPGEGHRIIRHELPCSPCFRLEGDDKVQSCTHHDCLMTITPKEVYETVNSAVSTVRRVRVGSPSVSQGSIGR